MQVAPGDAPLTHEVRVGIMALVVLGLDFTPGPDVLDTTRQVWEGALRWHGLDDGEISVVRVREAFMRLCMRCTGWPKPGQLVALLPEPPRPEPSAEQIAAQRERLEETAVERRRQRKATQQSRRALQRAEEIENERRKMVARGALRAMVTYQRAVRNETRA